VKELRGFFLAPIPGGIVAAGFGATVGYAQVAHRIIALFLFICLMLYATQLVFGIAIRAFLRRRNLATIGAYALGGLAMTSIPNLPYTAWSMSLGHPLTAASAYFALIALYGSITGISYWSIMRPDRPNIPLP
jgi:hypothetical protein